MCFVIPGWLTKGMGGAELQAFLLAEELVKRNWKIEVVSSKRPILFPEYFNDKITYHYYKKSSFKLLFFIRVLKTFFQTQSYYYYNRTNAPILRGACSWYCKLKRKKMIYAVAGDSETGYFSFAKEIRIRTPLDLLKYTDALIIDCLVKKSVHAAHLVLTQSQQQQLALLKNTGIHSYIMRSSVDKIFYINNPIKKNTILWIGNLRKIKQPEVFVQIASEIKLNGWQYKIIGRIADPDYAYVKTIHDKTINYQSEMSLEAANREIAQARIIVNTSVTEGFSNTFIQAWLNNTLVISLNANPDELLSQKKYGIFCNGDREKLKQSIINATGNYEQYISLMQSAKEFALQEFDISKNTNNLIRVLEQL